MFKKKNLLNQIIILFFVFVLAIPVEVGATLGVDWIVLPAGTDTGIKFGTTIVRSVSYGNGIWVAVGSSGKASYSSDGINWTSLPAGASTGIKAGTDSIYSVAYGNSLWIASADNGKASYSSDGINWTALPSGASTGIKFWPYAARSVAYGNGTWVVVGSGGKASYSSDGINWTALTPGDSTGIKFGTPDSSALASVAYGNGTWVVVGSGGKASYSSDGISWTSLTPGDDTGIRFGTTDAHDVSYDNGIWVAVGSSGKASYSSDGINWTSLPAGIDTGIKFGTSTIARSVSYGNDKWIAVGDSGKASYSSDGINWTSLTAGIDTGIKFGTSTLATSIAYGNGTWVAVGQSGKASFSPTVTSPSVLTNDATSITSSEATLNAEITDYGYENASESGFTYGTSSDLSTVIATTTLGSQVGTTTFSEAVSGLSPNTTYYFRAYAVNGAGTSTGSILSFDTSPDLPSITTSAASSVTKDTAILNGDITDTGGENASERGFVYGLTSTYTATSSSSGSFSTGTFSQLITGLSCGTAYHYASYATNSSGTTYGSDTTFITSDCPEDIGGRRRSTPAQSQSINTNDQTLTQNKVISVLSSLSYIIENIDKSDDLNEEQRQVLLSVVSTILVKLSQALQNI